MHNDLLRITMVILCMTVSNTRDERHLVSGVEPPDCVFGTGDVALVAVPSELCPATVSIPTLSADVRYLITV